jgi:hypothetical protein
MPNDEMNDEAQMPEGSRRLASDLWHSSFVIRISFVIRHSDFVIHRA